MLTSNIPAHLVDMSFGDAAIVAVLGYAVVFFGLILLMCVVMAMGKIFIAKEKKAAATVETNKAAVPAAATGKAEHEPG